MKKNLLSLIAILFSIATYADTIPAGPISGTWTLAGSPYLIMGETTIDSGTTLTIEPGVLVEWQFSFTMHVQGQILAEGTETDSIIFTAADTAVGFKSIRFIETPAGNDTSKFGYCVFKYGRVWGGFPDNCGGAIGAINYDKFVIDHCLFDHNKAVQVNLGDPFGGAIALWTSSPVIRNSTFINNVSKYGGAIDCYAESHPVIDSNVFTDNTAYEYGGAIICLTDSDPRIDHNLFYNNTAYLDGGAIELEINCSPDIINNTIAHNEAFESGGGINLWEACSPQIQNNILWGNTAGEGNQVNIETGNCVPNFYYSDIQGGQDSIGGVPVTGEYRFCIDDDPLFVDPPTGDYHLTYNSPCINTGDPTILDPDSTISDMGAFYYHLFVGYSEFRIQDSEYRIECYPNPACGIMNIEYRISNVEVVGLSVFDIYGKEIAALVDETQAAGEYTVRFDASHIPAGIYLIRLQISNEVVTKKIIKQ